MWAKKNRPTGLTDRKIKALSKDEHQAHREYSNFANDSKNPEIKKKFHEMSEDERKHARFLKDIKEDVNHG